MRDIVVHQAGNAEALRDRMAALNEVAEAADEVPADTDVGWTGRTMKVPWFAEHMREELVLHGWDITGASSRSGACCWRKAPKGLCRASASRRGCG